MSNLITYCHSTLFDIIICITYVIVWNFHNFSVSYFWIAFLFSFRITTLIYKNHNCQTLKLRAIRLQSNIDFFHQTLVMHNVIGFIIFLCVFFLKTHANKFNNPQKPGIIARGQEIIMIILIKRWGYDKPVWNIRLLLFQVFLDTNTFAGFIIACLTPFLVFDSLW